MKNTNHILSFDDFLLESSLFEGAVKEFEMDCEELIQHVKDGYGWIDPQSVEDTWMSISNIPYKPLIKEGILKRLIKAGVLFHSEDRNPEKKGKKITDYKQVAESFEFIAEGEVDPRVKKEAISRLSQFFRVPASNLMKFKFDGTDNVKQYAAALDATSDEGAEVYYKMAIKLAKEEFGIHESEVNEAKEEFVVGYMAGNVDDMKKGDAIKVNALQYTSKGDNDKIDIIRGDGKKTKVAKKDLTVKI